MHRLHPFRSPSGWWSPKLSPAWVRFWRPLRRLMRRVQYKLDTIELRSLEHLRHALDCGHGVLITPNHVQYPDPFIMYEAADQVRRPFYFMTAWQAFGTAGFLERMVLRQHGCFSVDREGVDRRAFRQAIEILESRPNPLVVFPEGDIHHLNDRVTPFREGPAAIALATARRAVRPIVCVPCGLKYYYLQDPTPELNKLMDELEQALHWRPTPDWPLTRRIYRLAEGALALKEIEYLGSTCSGSLPDRIRNLEETVLRQLEQRYGTDSRGGTVPERVKSVRQQAIPRLAELAEDDPRRAEVLRDLDDVFFVVQLFCYPGDYVAQQPTIERIAETLDKFEEDILGAPLAKVRGVRAAIATFGEPIPIEADTSKKAAASALTQLLEERVQALLDATVVPGRATTDNPVGFKADFV